MNDADPQNSSSSASRLDEFRRIMSNIWSVYRGFKSLNSQQKAQQP